MATRAKRTDKSWIFVGFASSQEESFKQANAELCEWIVDREKKHAPVHDLSITSIDILCGPTSFFGKTEWHTKINVVYTVDLVKKKEE